MEASQAILFPCVRKTVNARLLLATNHAPGFNDLNKASINQSVEITPKGALIRVRLNPFVLRKGKGYVPTIVVAVPVPGILGLKQEVQAHLRRL